MVLQTEEDVQSLVRLTAPILRQLQVLSVKCMSSTLRRQTDRSLVYVLATSMSGMMDTEIYQCDVVAELRGQPKDLAFVEYLDGVTETEYIYQKMDVTPIDRKGERFDPNLENAVLQGTAEEGEPGTVCQVLQKGYRMGDRVLRHAMVKVVAE